MPSWRPSSPWPLPRRPPTARPASYYVALGDSLAAGYQPDPAIGRDQGYVGRVHRALGRGLKLENLGCDGATTTTLLSGGGGCTYGAASSQLVAAERFLRRNRHQIRVVTIDIGGNDVEPLRRRRHDRPGLHAHRPGHPVRPTWARSSTGCAPPRPGSASSG